MFAAGVFELIEARKNLLASSNDAVKLIVALVVTAAVGYATIPWLLAYLRRSTTFVFIVYRIVLAAVLVALLASGRITN